MSEGLFGNNIIISWLQYYAENTHVDLQKVKILDITKKNKNLIPTIESNECVMVFTEAGHPDIFYSMWEAGLGECDVWYNIGSEPSGEIKKDKIKDMIDRGINASAAMMIINPNAHNTIRIGMKNSSFTKGSVQYVGSEIRSVILNKMHVSYGDTICIISGESIAIESAIISGEGHIIAVEYSPLDRKTLEDNIEKFGIRNISIVDEINYDEFAEFPVPTMAMLVASEKTEQEIQCMLKLNPEMEFVIYTPDFKFAAEVPMLFEKYGIGNMEMIQVTVLKMVQNIFQPEPSPWIISGVAKPKN